MTTEQAIIEDVAARARALYEEKLKALLEKTHADEFVIIESDSGDYFLGRTMSEAIHAKRQIHAQRRGHILRVGHQVAVHIGN